MNDLESNGQAQWHHRVLQEMVRGCEAAKDVSKRIEHVQAILVSNCSWVAVAWFQGSTHWIARLVLDIRDLKVDHATDGVAEGQDVCEEAEWPNDVLDGNQPTGEDEAREPALHECHHAHEWVVELNAEHLGETLPGIHGSSIKKNHHTKVLKVPLANNIAWNAKSAESKHEHERQLKETVRRDVGHWRDHAVLHLSSDRFELRVIRPDGNHSQIAGDANEPDAKEHLVRNLVLRALSGLDVDDCEENVREQHDKTTTKEECRITESQESLSSKHDHDLGAERSCESSPAVVSCVLIVDAHFCFLASFVGFPCVKELLHTFLRSEV
mmetsp:Transcript_61481/g.114141  ORF Transcript_61481/g.114141 Transcript_61481/m.114141 type:complete len:326 (-) Transcript_61481:233-1210(-)